MIKCTKSSVISFKFIIMISLVAVIPLLTKTTYTEIEAKVATNNVSMAVSTDPSMSSIQRSQSSVGINNNNNINNGSTGEYTLRRGIISSEPGQPEQLKVQRTIILEHRLDGKDYTGTLTFTASKPVEVLFGHRLNIDNKTLSNIDMKKFGSLFLVNPIHPNAGYVLSAPTVIKPDYRGSTPPYFSASLPFVASSVVLRTLGAMPFIAIYEVSARIGQPQIINNVTTAQNSNGSNDAK
jgi:hypothetical protein